MMPDAVLGSRRGRALRARGRRSALVAFLALGCGARTGLGGIGMDTPDETAFPAGDASGSTRFPAEDASGAGARGSAGLPSACPACPGPPGIPCAESQPVGCVEPDGCTLGWCGNSIGFVTSRSLCVPDHASTGICASEPETDTCVLLSPTTCIWPPKGAAQAICTGVVRGAPCGRIECGPGCQCLCENLCWCGPVGTGDGG